MITKIDQALISRFRDCGFDIATEYPGQLYKPTAGTPWVRLRTLQNPVLPATMATHNDTTGVFQVVVHWPQGRSHIKATEQLDTIFAAYPVGRRLSFRGQVVTVTGHHRQSSRIEDGWLKVVGLINYRADVAR